MKIYAPNLMIREVERISQAHPLSGDISRQLPSDQLEKLVKKIDAKTIQELPALIGTLTRRQGRSLCIYLPQNTYHADIGKIKFVIAAKMDAGCYSILFRQWQKFPECGDCLELLGKYDTKANHGAGFPVKRGLLRSWSCEKDPLAAVIQSAADIPKCPQFMQRLSAIGIDQASNLAKACQWKFLCQASEKEFQQETDASIAQILRSQDAQHQAAVLKRLLFWGRKNTAFLLSFPRVYPFAYALWREPRPNLLPEKELNDAYTWWYNYYQVSQSLHGDQRRIDFWKQFLNRCQCSRVRSHEMLVMRFGSRVVTEFETMGAVYIFSTDYFDGTVRAHMSSSRTGALKSWMYNDAAYLSREVHKVNWEISQSEELFRCDVI